MSEEGQPLAANVERLARTMEMLGTPLPGELAANLARAGRRGTPWPSCTSSDPLVLLAVTINPEERCGLVASASVRSSSKGGTLPCWSR